VVQAADNMAGKIGNAAAAEAEEHGMVAVLLSLHLRARSSLNLLEVTSNWMAQQLAADSHRFQLQKFRHAVQATFVSCVADIESEKPLTLLGKSPTRCDGSFMTLPLHQ